MSHPSFTYLTKNKNKNILNENILISAVNRVKKYFIAISRIASIVISLLITN